jgi:hypothetical protein
MTTAEAIVRYRKRKIIRGVATRRRAAIDIEPEMQMNTRGSGRFPGCALLPFGGDTMDISLLRT